MIADSAKRADADRKLFDRIAKQYAVKDLLPAQRAARQQRLRQTITRVKFQRGKVLEIGCGAGFGARYLSGMYNQYLGVDYSSELIKYARTYNCGPNVSFVAADINDFETDEQYDAAFMIGLLHHIPDPKSALTRISRFVKPGGWIVANEPQSGNPIITLARAVRKILDRSYSADQNEYDREQLVRIFQDSGLEQVNTFPQGIFSTPFAEIAMPLQPFFTPLSKLACYIDGILESNVRRALYRVAWNLVAVGRRP